jgi:phage FluMu protein Com
MMKLFRLIKSFFFRKKAVPVIPTPTVRSPELDPITKPDLVPEVSQREKLIYIVKSPIRCVVCGKDLIRDSGQYMLYCSRECRKLGRGGKRNYQTIYAKRKISRTFKEEVANEGNKGGN